MCNLNRWEPESWDLPLHMGSSAKTQVWHGCPREDSHHLLDPNGGHLRDREGGKNDLEVERHRDQALDALPEHRALLPDAVQQHVVSLDLLEEHGVQGGGIEGLRLHHLREIKGFGNLCNNIMHTDLFTKKKFVYFSSQ